MAYKNQNPFNEAGHVQILCDKCGKDVWDGEANCFRSSIIKGKHYSHLCYACHDEIATPLKVFQDRLRAIGSSHCEEARKIIQQYRNENDSCIHTSFMEIWKEQTDYYPKYL